ncbi:MAG: type II secretion system protein [Coleofasciculaceae cyanobacterium SM2_3_26]|nr:type II secretion system protein [Coleofasciculaceae cyanobacterium SM2_3_26]
MNSQFRGALKLAQALKQRPTQAGFTLLESLVAIVAITFVTVSITPPIFISVATRFQSQKAEQASYLAQGQVDKVRVIVERGGKFKEEPEKYLPAQAGVSATQIVNAPAPSSAANYLDSSNNNCNPKYDGEQIPATQALPVDINGDCEIDFYVQVFRSQNVTSGPGQNTETLGSVTYPASFVMGVRVYGVAAKAGFGSLSTKPSDLLFTSGEGSMRTRPLAVLYTTVAQGDFIRSFDRIDGLQNQ